MSYEVKRVIEFGQENRKPVGLLKGAVLLKDGTEPVLQLKLRNNGKDILNRLSVKITCLGKDGQVKGVQRYTYEKIFVTSGMEFGTDVAIPLKDKDVEQVEVEVEDDCQSLKVSSRSIQKPKPKVCSYNKLVGTVSIVILLAGIWSTCSMFHAWFYGGSYASDPILNSMYLYGITQYMLAASKMEPRRLYSLNYTILIMGIICIVPTVLRLVSHNRGIYVDSDGIHGNLYTQCEQVFYFINSMVMLIILVKNCDKKLLCFVSFIVLVGMIPIIEMKNFLYWGRSISEGLQIINHARKLNPTYNYMIR